MGKIIKMRIDADETQLILDLPDFSLIPPETGIYDEPLRWYKANIQWAKLIEGFVGHLLSYHAWKNAENENYIGVQEIATWLEGVEDPTPAFPTEGDCFDYPLYAPFINYEPQHPFNEPDYIPPDYLMPPFLVNTALEYPEILGYQATDVFVPFGAVTIDPIDLTTFNLPQLQISVKGSGQIELDLLAVAFGGVAVAKVGSLPNIADIILDNIYDTGIQLFDLEVPSGTIAHAGNVIRSTEINIEAEPEETTIVYVVFAPKINDSIIPIAFGGGVRAIQLCGFEGGGEIVTGVLDVRFNEETCFLEKFVAGEWLPVDGWEDLEACIGGGMATKEDIKQALIEWTEDTASRYLGVVLDEDGNPTIPDGGTGEDGVPPDDPDTPDINEELEAKAGGAIYLTDKLQKILTDMFTWFSGYVSPSTGVTSQMAEDRLVLLYGFGQAAANIFANYWYTVYMNSSGAVTLNEAVLDGFFFCRGVSKATLARYIYETHATAAEVPVLEVFAEQLTEEQMSGFFNTGTATPSTAYETYSCTKIDTETITLDMSTGEFVQKTTSGVWKQNHRYRIKSSGTFVDGDNANIISDMYWTHNTLTDVKTFQNAGAYNGSGVPSLTAATVPFEPSHIYNVIVDKTGVAGAIIVSRDNAPFNLPNTTGILTNIIEDLGEFTV